MALERFLKRSGVRPCPGGPLSLGKEFSMVDPPLPTSSPSSSASSAAAAAAAAPDVPEDGHKKGTLKRRLAKGFHNLWIDKVRNWGATR